MDETVLATHEIHKRAEIDEIDDLAVIDLADFSFLGDAENPLTRGFDLRGIRRADLDQPFVINIDLGTGGGDDLADHLAARADDFTDLRLVDLQRLDAWGMRRKLGARMVKRLGHFAKDMRTAFVRLRERLLHDRFGDARDLDVHLQRGDAFARARNLEVHVAEVILVAKNVRNHRKILAFKDQAHRDSRNRALERHAGIHHRQRTAADGCH